MLLSTALCSTHGAMPQMWPWVSVPSCPRGPLNSEQRKWRRWFAFPAPELTAAPQWGPLCQGPLQANLQHAHAGAKTALAVTAICRQTGPTVPSGALCPNALWGGGWCKQRVCKRKALQHFCGTDTSTLLLCRVNSLWLCPSFADGETEAARKAMCPLPPTGCGALLQQDGELRTCLWTERPSHHPVSLCTSIPQLSNYPQIIISAAN